MRQVYRLLGLVPGLTARVTAQRWAADEGTGAVLSAMLAELV